MNRFISVMALIVFLVTSFTVGAQTSKLNAQKYWEYRERLVYDFMLGIGDENGYSLPGFRSLHYNALKHGDAVVELGHYLSVLGTEYALLAKNNTNTDRTKQELYYALSTMNRLDYYAETYFYDQDSVYGKPSLNGFFIRDDVGYVSDRNLQSLNTSPLYPAVSKNLSQTQKPSNRTNELSQDQVYHLFMGLALIYKYLPDSVTHNNIPFRHWNQAPENASLKQEAAGIAKRIIEHMLLGNTENNKSIIINPVTHLPVMRGSKFFPHNYAMVQAYSFFGGDIEKLNISKSKLRFWKRSARAVYGRTALRLTNKKGQGPMSMLPMLFIPATDKKFGVQKRFEDIVTRFDIDHEYFYLYFPYAYNLLYDLPSDFCSDYQENLRQMLNQAPLGKVFYYDAKHNIVKNGAARYADTLWRASSLNIHPEQRLIGPVYHAWGDYNGIDYMLLHNLYCLYYQESEAYGSYSISIRPKVANTVSRESKRKPTWYNVGSLMPNTFNKSYIHKQSIQIISFNSLTQYGRDLKFPRAVNVNRQEFNVNAPYPLYPKPSLMHITHLAVLGEIYDNSPFKNSVVFNINEGAVMLIDEDTKLVLRKSSELHVKAGGSLILGSNAELALHDQTVVYVDSGASLSFSPNSTLNLKDSACKIVFKHGSSFELDSSYSHLFQDIKTQHPAMVKKRGKGHITFLPAQPASFDAYVRRSVYQGENFLQTNNDWIELPGDTVVLPFYIRGSECDMPNIEKMKIVVHNNTLRFVSGKAYDSNCDSSTGMAGILVDFVLDKKAYPNYKNLKVEYVRFEQ